MNKTIQYSHVVATLGLVLRNKALLLLKRNTMPKIWAPPGGRLEQNENPTAGLEREIHEECGIDVEVIMPIDTWFGPHEGVPTLGIIYLCKNAGGTVSLSKEHSEARWFMESTLNEAMRLSPESFFGTEQLYRRAFRLNEGCYR